MAMRSLVGKLRNLPRRLAGAVVTKDDASLERVPECIRPLVEERRRRTREEIRAYNRKAWLKTIAAYGSVGYLLTSAVRVAANKNDNN